MVIPAISLHEPWASAVRLGLKKIETRGDIPIWRSRYRGPIAIHHAKKHFRQQDWDQKWISEVRAAGWLCRDTAWESFAAQFTLPD
jgi:hypothetical protein